MGSNACQFGTSPMVLPQAPPTQWMPLTAWCVDKVLGNWCTFRCKESPHLDKVVTPHGTARRAVNARHWARRNFKRHRILNRLDRCASEARLICSKPFGSEGLSPSSRPSGSLRIRPLLSCATALEICRIPNAVVVRNMRNNQQQTFGHLPPLFWTCPPLWTRGLKAFLLCQPYLVSAKLPFAYFCSFVPSCRTPSNRILLMTAACFSRRLCNSENVHTDAHGDSAHEGRRCQDGHGSQRLYGTWTKPLWCRGATIGRPNCDRWMPDGDDVEKELAP